MQSNAIQISEAYPTLRPKNGSRQVSGPEGRSFKDVCAEYLKDVNSLQKNADEMAGKVATGEVENLHEIVIALNEAELSFKLMMQVRNKLVSAYKEIMQMRV